MGVGDELGVFTGSEVDVEEGDGDTVVFGDWEGDGEGFSVGEGSGDGVGAGVGVGDGLGIGVGVGEGEGGGEGGGWFAGSSDVWFVPKIFEPLTEIDWGLSLVGSNGISIVVAGVVGILLKVVVWVI